MEAEQYYRIKRSALPEILHKVLAVQERLQSGEARSVNEACRQLELSRSTYYKYRESIEACRELRLASLVIQLEPESAVLAGLFALFAEWELSLRSLYLSPSRAGRATLQVSFDLPKEFETNRFKRRVAQLPGLSQLILKVD